jgi:dTDP-4-dehydrorhamnose 3,5-epimerase
VQCSLSRNTNRWTVRGMHLQLPPSMECKLVRCVRGAICDVAIDLRPASPTFGRHFKVELTARDGVALWLPPLVAHGFMTLEADTHVLYEMGDYYAPELAASVRWNDPFFGIDWPKAGSITISDKDAAVADFDVSAWHSRVEEASKCELAH